jgi:putative Holliday junction resolvase
VRFLGVDYGSSRTGLAVSDPLGVTCRPFGILAERDEDRLVAEILSTARQLAVEAIVIGVPRPLSGGTNQQLETVLSFVRHLQRDAQIEQDAQFAVSVWDERFTSSLARRGRAHSANEDAVAACYMLQSYLDAQSGTTGGR